MKKIKFLIVIFCFIVNSQLSFATEKNCSSLESLKDKIACKIGMKKNNTTEKSSTKTNEKNFFKKMGNPFKKLNDFNKNTKKTLF